MRALRITTSGRIPLVALLALASGCGSSNEQPIDSPGANAQRGALMQDLTVTEVAAYQALKVPLAKDGKRQNHGDLKLVAQRDVLVRVFVKPEPGFVSREVIASVKLTVPTPTKGSVQVVEGRRVVSGASTDENLDSTINVEIPAVNVAAGARFSVALTDPKTPVVDLPAVSAARYPVDGSLDDLGVESTGDRLRVVVVPVKYNVDGQGDTPYHVPDTSPAAIKTLAELMNKIYPTPIVEVSVHAPLDWKKPGGLPELLTEIQTLRGKENPPKDVYYYGYTLPLGDLAGPTGLSVLGFPASVGVAHIGGDRTMAHEIGHAHGAMHAPGCGANNPDPKFPHDTGGPEGHGSIGVWGYDQIGVESSTAPGGREKQLIVPHTADIMTYCRPSWISDYFYRRFFKRVADDSKAAGSEAAGTKAAGYAPPEQRTYRMIRVEDHEGTLSWGSTMAFDAYPRHGEPHQVVYEGEYGGPVGSDTALYYPYSHLPGGLLLVPENEASFAIMHVRGLGPHADVGIARVTRAP